MFYKKAIEHCTIFKNYNDFLKEVNSMGAKLHFDPPHITFKKDSNLTGEKFHSFIVDSLKEGVCYVDFYKYNKQFIFTPYESEEEIPLQDFLAIVDKYNGTTCAWKDGSRTHDLKVFYFGDNEYNRILVIPEGYSDILKKVVDSL